MSQFNNDQDWKTVTWQKKPNKTLTQQDLRKGRFTTKKKINNNSSNSHNSQKMYKLDESDESQKIKRVPIKVGTMIMQARNKKKLTQKDLAKQLNLPARIIINYENGTAIPNGIYKRKIENALEIKIPKIKN